MTSASTTTRGPKAPFSLAPTAPSCAPWRAGRYEITFDAPRVMGIVNLTPDSFFDGGRHPNPHAALGHAQNLLAQGADILDFGAESTRPGAQAVPPEEEWARLAPILHEAVRWGVPISVDTRRTEVMARALDLGVDILNDVQALQAPGALACAAAHPQVAVCLMHMRAEPSSMQQHTHYEGDPVASVIQWLAQRVAAVEAAGIARCRLAIDPGIGFAKTPEHNLALLARQTELQALGVPVLVGWSRKSTLGLVTGRETADRLAASVAAAVLALQGGAQVLRVHDVAATVDAVKVWRAVQTHQPERQ